MATDNETDAMMIFLKWQDFLEWLLPTTDKFPKKVRFSFGLRIEQLALDVIEDLIEARYSRKDRDAVLKRANLRLEKLRVMLRLSHKMRYLSYESHAHAMRAINETGRMLGGWRKHEG